MHPVALQGMRAFASFSEALIVHVVRPLGVMRTRVFVSFLSWQMVASGVDLGCGCEANLCLTRETNLRGTSSTLTGYLRQWSQHKREATSKARQLSLSTVGDHAYVITKPRAMLV